MSPNEKLLLVVGGPVVVAAVIGWLFHWYVLDARSWWRELRGWWASLYRSVTDLPGPDSLSAPRAGEYQLPLGATFRDGQTWDRDLDPPGGRPQSGERFPVAPPTGETLASVTAGQAIDHDAWDRLDPDQAADLLIAEWHNEPAPLHLEPWQERAWWNDPDLTVWDARLQADRCWEILHVEFPRLRAELGCPA